MLDDSSALSQSLRCGVHDHLRVRPPHRLPCCHPTANGLWGLRRRDTDAVEFTDTVSRRLSLGEREALSPAVEQVNDFLLSEIVELYDDAESVAVTRMFSGLFLPNRHADYYDVAMLRRLYVCLIVEPPRFVAGIEKNGGYAWNP